MISREACAANILKPFPDLPGCMSDGETEDEALANGRDAFASVVSVLHDMGREIPAPSFNPNMAAAQGVSGKLVAHVPKSIYAKLTPRSLVGESPTWVIVSREPSIEPCCATGNGCADA